MNKRRALLAVGAIAILASQMAGADIMISSHSRWVDARAQAGNWPLDAETGHDALPGPFSCTASATGGPIDYTGETPAMVESLATMVSSGLDATGWTATGEAASWINEEVADPWFIASSTSWFDLTFQVTDTAYIVTMWWDISAEGAGGAAVSLEDCLSEEISFGSAGDSSSGSSSFVLGPGYYDFTAWAYSSICASEPGPTSGYGQFDIGVSFEALPPPVPEPASLSLLGLGVAGLAARRFGRK